MLFKAEYERGGSFLQNCELVHDILVSNSYCDTRHKKQAQEGFK